MASAAASSSSSSSSGGDQEKFISVLAEPSVPVDSLGYIDTEYDDPAVRARVDALVVHEMHKFTPGDYLAKLPPPPAMDFGGSAALQAEYARVGRRDTLDVLDTSRYTVPGVSAAKQGDEAEWKKAIDNAKAQLEHQHLRVLNLELMQKFSSSAWKSHQKAQSEMNNRAAAMLGALRRKAEAVNASRKAAQHTKAPRLRTQTRKWDETVVRNYNVEVACAAVERDLKRLRRELGDKGEATNPAAQ